MTHSETRCSKTHYTVKNAAGADEGEFGEGDMPMESTSLGGLARGRNREWAAGVR